VGAHYPSHFHQLARPRERRRAIARIGIVLEHRARIIPVGWLALCAFLRTSSAPDLATASRGCAMRAARDVSDGGSSARTDTSPIISLQRIKMSRNVWDRNPRDLYYFILMVSPLVPSCSLAPREVERRCKTTPSALRSTMPPMPPARVSPASAAT
jgi:hypothetical protein